MTERKNTNRIEIDGFVHKIELRYTKSGTPIWNGILRFNIHKDKESGEWSAEFIDIKAFSDLAEQAKRELNNKDKVKIIGWLRIEKWQDKEGNNRNNTVINLNEFKLISDARVTENDELSSYGTDFDEDDIPF